MDGAQLKNARKAKGWSLREAAKHLGVDHNTVYQWERGEVTPRGYNRQKIEEMYGISFVPFSSVTSLHVEVPSFVLKDITMRLQSIAFTPCSTFHDIKVRMQQYLEEWDAIMDINDLNRQITRRNALRRVASFPFVFFAGYPAVNYAVEEILNQCGVSIAGCWELSKSKNRDDLKLAFDSVTFNILVLDSVTVGDRYRNRAAMLQASACCLKVILGMNLENTQEAIRYAKQAIDYSKSTDDIPLKINSWKYLAWAYNYDVGQDKKALNAIQQAVLLYKQHRKTIPRVVQGDIYSTLAYIQAKNHQNSSISLQIAEKALAYNEESVYCSDGALPLLQIHLMMTLFSAGDYVQGEQIAKNLIDFETLKMKVPLSERNRLIIINSVLEATLKQQDKDMEQIIFFLQTGIEGARALQSEQRFREAVINYTVLSTLWPNEKRIIELRPLISHW